MFFFVSNISGQGVVMEGSPFSDYATVDAAFKQGWIDVESKFFLTCGVAVILTCGQKVWHKSS